MKNSVLLAVALSLAAFGCKPRAFNASEESSAATKNSERAALPWLGGVFSYQLVSPSQTKDLDNPTGFVQQCSGLFELEKSSTKTYKI